MYDPMLCNVNNGLWYKDEFCGICDLCPPHPADDPDWVKEMEARNTTFRLKDIYDFVKMELYWKNREAPIEVSIDEYIYQKEKA